jgi:serine/threonine-protein kinase
MGTETEHAGPLTGKVIAGRYRVAEEVGKGGVGAVYRGEHVGMGKAVAVKVLHSLYAAQNEFRRRFEREARAASKLSHPACVSVLDYGDFEGQPYLVMEYAQGRLLAERLEEGPLEPKEAVLVARGVAAALRHAHGLGIVHRDLKPSNVMLTGGAQAGVPCKLLDFGLAKTLNPEPGDDLTQVGMVFGTPGYLSPEQAQGQPADARSDLYSLGVLMWEMLAGRKPFHHADDPLKILRDHVNTPAPSIREVAPTVSPELDATIAKLMAKDPRERYQNAEALVLALEQLPESEGTLAPELAALSSKGQSAPTPQPGTRANPRQIGAGSAVAVVLYAIAAFAWHHAHSSARISAAEQATQVTGEFDGDAAERARGLAHSAHDRIAKLGCTQGLGLYQRAIDTDSTWREAPQVLSDALHCLTDSQHGRMAAAKFLGDYLGSAARPALTELAHTHHVAEVRHAAEYALERIKP